MTRVQWTGLAGQPRWWSCIHSRYAAIFLNVVKTRSPEIRSRAGGQERSSRFLTRIGTGRGSKVATRARKKACCWYPFAQRVKATGNGHPCSNSSKSMSWWKASSAVIAANWGRPVALSSQLWRRDWCWQVAIACGNCSRRPVESNRQSLKVWCHTEPKASALVKNSSSRHWKPSTSTTAAMQARILWVF